jgi:ABC-type Fe3+ transport system permease subunit
MLYTAIGTLVGFTLSLGYVRLTGKDRLGGYPDISTTLFYIVPGTLVGAALGFGYGVKAIQDGTWPY